jgi:CRISPR-associated protein Cas2
MGRTVSLICYDIADPKRLRQVFAICKAHGDHLQYSVFKVALTDSGRVSLIAKLSDAIHHQEDRVLFVRLGPEGPETRARCETLGRQEPYALPVVTIV